MFQSKIQYWYYRLGTILKSFKTLYTLPPEKVDAFVNSYGIYNYDWDNEEELIQKFGPNYYDDVKKHVLDYYSVISHLCAIGQVEKMYIPAAMDLSKSFSANQRLIEAKMCRDLGIGKGDKVLDIGCGRGRIASHVASLTNARVTGINIDAEQLESAKRFVLAYNLADRCQFQLADLNHLPLPFPDRSFDAVYEIGVFTYSRDLKKLFQELHRVLKPGGKFACQDWVHLPNYNPNDPHHLELMRRVKPLIGAIATPSIETFSGKLREAGFKLLVNENASIDGLQAPLIENIDGFFTRVTKVINFLVKCKILPAHFTPLFNRLTQDGEAFVEADRLRLVTTSHYVVAQKPVK